MHLVRRRSNFSITAIAKHGPAGPVGVTGYGSRVRPGRLDVMVVQLTECLGDRLLNGKETLWHQARCLVVTADDPVSQTLRERAGDP